MNKDTKINILQGVVNAGIGGTTREMLDNVKAIIKAMESEGVCKVLPEAKEEIKIEVRKSPGRPKKR